MVKSICNIDIHQITVFEPVDIFRDAGPTSDITHQVDRLS